MNCVGIWLLGETTQEPWKQEVEITIHGNRELFVIPILKSMQNLFLNPAKTTLIDHMDGSISIKIRTSLDSKTMQDQNLFHILDSLPRLPPEETMAS